ncbi:hypothetical protein F5X99DRAFT_420058 [Biscogniauxia marginata]|nr:hypothetical protein F5X99DRAFT_420058 [Biscogniauxia marginata]
MARATNHTTNQQRRGPYLKLISRFYEPLILLTALGKTRGAHISAPYDPTPFHSKRRRLLRNLSYLCDYDKGGDTTCSIGLEERPECFNFWVASNKASSGGRIIQFLQSTLVDVQRIIVLEERERFHEEEAFIRKCIEFARPRVNKEIRLFLRYAKRCKKYLDREKVAADAQIVTWLEQFDLGEDMLAVDVCYLAYRERKASHMQWLSEKIDASSNVDSSFEETIAAFRDFRHCLGRLAHHVRAPKEVLEDSPGFHRLFDEYDVRLVKTGPSNPRPSADALTELSSILGRMLPAKDSNLTGYRESLIALDQKFNIHSRVHACYRNKNFKPRVHAEIQILEHFYKGNLTFVDNDSYIGCSKPACYCCHLYFRHHPYRPVEPESHQNIWLNWGVPHLPDGGNDRGYKVQRDLLIKMLESIRKEALDQIIQRACPLRRHADSETGITKSIMSLSLGVNTARASSPETRAAAVYLDTVTSGANPNVGRQPDPPPDTDSSSTKEAVDSSGDLPEDCASDSGSGSDSDGGASL